MSIVTAVIERMGNQFARISNPRMKKIFKLSSHMTYRERVALYKLSRSSHWIAEIGAYTGTSTCCFGLAAVDFGGKKIISIDTWNNEGMAEGLRDTWSDFKRTTSEFSDFIIPVRGFSADVVDEVRNLTASLDLLFIDGDHSYEGVKADWENYRNFLTTGAIVVFHDIGWAEGVQRVINEDVTPLVSSCDQLPNMWWGVVK